MELVTEDEARAIFAGIENRLVECHARAFRQWRVFATQLPTASTRGRRTILNELIIEEVRREFGSDQTAKIQDTADGRTVLHYGGLAIRFKHLDRQFRAATFPTPTATLVESPVLIAGLPGRRVTVGYRLDRLETEIAGVYAAFYVKRRTPAWHYEFGKPAAQMTLLPPVNPATPPAQPSRIRPKTADQAAKVLKFPDRSASKK